MTYVSAISWTLHMVNQYNVSFAENKHPFLDCYLSPTPSVMYVSYYKNRGYCTFMQNMEHRS